MANRWIVPATWGSCLLVAFVIVKVLRIGPVIFVISDKMGWGVHTGDFLSFIPLFIAAGVTRLLR